MTNPVSRVTDERLADLIQTTMNDRDRFLPDTLNWEWRNEEVLAFTELQSLRALSSNSKGERGPCIPVVYCGLATSTHVPVGSDEDHCDLCGHPAQPYAQTNALPEYDPDAPPDHSADNAADFILHELAKALKVEFRPAEGSETWEGDVLGTMWHALTDSGVIDEWDGKLRVQPKGPQPQQVEVKALEWRKASNGDTREEAKCVLGIYRLALSNVTGKWRWSFNALDTPWSLELPTYEEARAGAQADYERRNDRDTAQSALSEALEVMRPFADAVFNDNGDMTVNTAVDAEDLIQAYMFLSKYGREGK